LPRSGRRLKGSWERRLAAPFFDEIACASPRSIGDGAKRRDGRERFVDVAELDGGRGHSLNPGRASPRRRRQTKRPPAAAVHSLALVQVHGGVVM
jgi:hypothetical protein